MNEMTSGSTGHAKAAPAENESLNNACPAISVVMAACNGEPYIGQQLESIISQLGEEDELLISIDSSADRTKETVSQMIARYPDQSIYVQAGPDKGVIANFESILALAANPVIVLADQDDCWHPKRLARVRQEFGKDPDLKAMVCDAAICDGNLQVISPSYFREHGTREGYWNNLIRNSFIGCCMALSKDVVDAALPFVQPLPMHDQYLGLLAYSMGHVLFLDEPLVDYRRHGGNATSLKPSSLSDQLKWRIWIFRAVSKARKRAALCKKSKESQTQAGIHSDNKNPQNRA